MHIFIVNHSHDHYLLYFSTLVIIIIIIMIIIIIIIMNIIIIIDDSMSTGLPRRIMMANRINRMGCVVFICIVAGRVYAYS